jgi:lysophospholipase L1-like esterase
MDSTEAQEENKRVTTQERNAMTQCEIGMNIPTIVGGKLMYNATRKPTPTVKTSTHTFNASPTGKKLKVKVVGDSHLKGIAIKIGQYLNTRYEVCSWVKTGAKIEELVNTLEKDCKCLDKSSKDDLFVIQVGAKIDESETTLENRGAKTDELVNTLEKVHKCLDKNVVVVSNQGAKTGKLGNLSVNGELKTEKLVNTSKKDCKCIDKNDVIVINGGVNDISTQKNQINKVVVKIARIMQKYNNSNIVIVNIPHRYDLNKNSVINLEIQECNKKLSKIARVFNHVTMIEADLGRKYFTRHGMHLNNSGKECLSNLIATQINRLANGNNKGVPVVPLSWKEELTDKQNIINLDNMIIEDKSSNKVVTRSRRLPVTRSNDFLW